MNDVPLGPYTSYGEPDEGDAVFVRRCEKCGRIVKADKTMTFQGEHMQPVEPNATCAKCGRVAMLWQGWF